MRLSVLVPTYRRVESLKRCLAALRAQERPPDEFLLVVRDTDEETRAFLATDTDHGLPLRVVDVSVPGQVAALNAGLEAASGEVVAITDDDGEPWPDWLARIEAHFRQDPELAGLGGRDWVYHGSVLDDGEAREVGRLRWFGKPVGNHHLALVGAPEGGREVDFLKGCNMSYRLAHVGEQRFDTRLRGAGSQITNDMAFGLHLRQRGKKLRYDPKVAINHRPAERLDNDKRGVFNEQAWANIVHNETVAIWEHLAPHQRPFFLLYSTLIGHREAYGLLQALRFAPREGRQAWIKLGLCLTARREGRQTAARQPRARIQS